jgi:hypothetical protein
VAHRPQTCPFLIGAGTLPDGAPTDTTVLSIWQAGILQIGTDWVELRVYLRDSNPDLLPAM